MPQITPTAAITPPACENSHLMSRYFPLDQIEDLRRNLPSPDVAAISSGNALRLLPRLSA
jgi:hypothetical protein